MADPFRITVMTPDDMTDLGRQLGEAIFSGAVVGLSGPLGAGKTTLARGVARGMEIDDGFVVSSPTYTIMQSYPCSGKILHHLDLYRIKSADDLDSTGYRDSMGEDTVLLVEWPEKEPSVLPRDHLVIGIEYEEEGREVSFFPTGERYEEVVKKVKEHWINVERKSFDMETRRHGDTE